MNINNDIGGLFAHFGHRCFHRTKRILQDRLHESAALDIDHTYFPLRCLQDNGPAAGRAVWVVPRAEQPRLGIDERKNLLLIPNVVATCHYRDSGAQEIDRDSPSYPTAASSVFAIHNREI